MYVCLIAISKSRTTKGCCVCIFIVMTADDLVTGGPRASANIMFSEKKMCTVAFLFHFPTLNQWMFFWNCSLNLLKDKDKMQILQLQCCDCWCTGDGYNWGICRHNILSGLLQGSKLRGAEGQNAPKLSPNAPRLLNLGAKFCYPIQPDICFEA